MLFTLISIGFLMYPFPSPNAIQYNQHWIPSDPFTLPNDIHLIRTGYILNHFPPPNVIPLNQHWILLNLFSPTNAIHLNQHWISTEPLSIA